jgi:[ribosomal protein S5]-alanine N-acetyltransferase
VLITLESKRLKLTPFSLDLKKAATNEKAKLAEMVGVRVPEHWPGRDLAEALPLLVADMEQDPLGAVWDGIIIHKADEVIIGDMGFKGGPNEEGIVEIGYSIIPEYRTHGYATGMAHRLISWAFQEQGIKVIMAECLKDNIGSIKVLEKVGMRRLEPEGNMLKWELRK